MPGSLLALSVAASFGGSMQPQMKPHETVLEITVNYLREDPDDGRFGMSRIPSVHGRPTSGSPERVAKFRDAWRDITESHDSILLAVGRLPRPNSHPDFGKRIRLYDSAINGVTGSTYYKDEYRNLATKLRLNADRMMTDKTKRDIKEVEFLGKWASTNLVSIFPSSARCLSCHKDVPKSEPIGVVALVRAQRN